MFDASAAQNIALEAISKKYQSKIEEIEKLICEAANEGNMCIMNIHFNSEKEKIGVSNYLKYKCNYKIIDSASDKCRLAGIGWYEYEEEKR